MEDVTLGDDRHEGADEGVKTLTAAAHLPCTNRTETSDTRTFCAATYARRSQAAAPPPRA